ncbi:hypothetical protein C4901_11240 [Acidiferrobacter sp. SPIII_3]|uniref:hypothetical protein n=1 Tax=Acidiferrobacter sp. SPIII_3 TaxID=1281578 RepID=UPI000D7E0BEA|nr:hypothetical protein [Acidiferrobacter sp. SPIII_3]AWP23829.1 hypothetical protein C4901_11240 [Acidiferrobacter sp. SPIII_3]
MLSYARKIADEFGEDPPRDVETCFNACRAFIDANADSIPPTEKRLSFAERPCGQNMRTCWGDSRPAERIPAAIAGSSGVRSPKRLPDLNT